MGFEKFGKVGEGDNAPSREEVNEQEAAQKPLEGLPRDPLAERETEEGSRSSEDASNA